MLKMLCPRVAYWQLSARIKCANAHLNENYIASVQEHKSLRRRTSDEPVINTALEKGDYVLLSVIDTGQGIPEEVLPHVFEPFFTAKQIGAGTGLGLPMVYSFAKQSGGHITISSEPGKGTSIMLYLKRAKQLQDSLPVHREKPA